MNLEYTWRWFGPNDPITLDTIKQTGATGIVSSLHHKKPGEVWSVEEINTHKKMIEANGLKWSVVESIPVHEDIKKQSDRWKEWIENYKESIENLASCNIKTVCYNFMPVLDWTRTDLEFPLGDGTTGLRFDQIAFIAFELYLLERNKTGNNYSKKQIEEAHTYFESLDDQQKKQLTNNIIAGLPGGHEEYGLDDFKATLQEYQSIDENLLRKHLAHFLKEIVPVAEFNKVKLCIHPDDPPYTILGLPRILSTEKDVKWLLSTIDSFYNGLTFCTGSFGVRADNDLPGIVKRFGERIHFLHLRSVQRESDGSFYEADHLGGSSRVAEVMHSLLSTFKSSNRIIPVRPDHGHKMMDDLNKKSNPGYSYIGRLDGLAKLKGLEKGIQFSLKAD
ncbi:mannonate dehydratase [Rhodohalobacter sp. 8-1]|uniref:mannonate dehydratase n=1 Tax=Rhodohalobacter sp. 8-1 TaxID=3131972 RepID=UPI0030ECAFEE